MKPLNTFIFHRITDGAPDNWADVNKFFFKAFIDDALNQNNSFASINQWYEKGEGNLCLTFDDGNLSDFGNVFPVLGDRGIKASFFIVPDFVGKKGFMNWSHIIELHKYGMEIGSHSLSHKFMTTLRNDDLHNEIAKSKKVIEDKIGSPINSFAYPYGDCSNKTHNIIKKLGYKNICTSKPGLNNSSRIIKRNSIHSQHKEKDIYHLLNPAYHRILLSSTKYYLRSALKKSLGMKNYLILKDAIYKK